MQIILVNSDKTKIEPFEGKLYVNQVYKGDNKTNIQFGIFTSPNDHESSNAFAVYGTKSKAVEVFTRVITTLSSYKPSQRQVPDEVLPNGIVKSYNMEDEPYPNYLVIPFEKE